MAQVLSGLPKFEDDNLIVGIETSDDAAIYKINDETAMIQTLDFFTPIVDNPYMFGQIAAANSLSDVYAMGGEPKVALNIVGFPSCLDNKILGEILRGGADKVKEAGAILVGGHTVQNDEPQYGLSVSGFVHPNKIFKNFGAKPGDVLVLTKQIGSGVVNTAIKAGFASENSIKEVEKVLSSLNKKAKEVIENFDINACTDITGFGLLGHLVEMAKPCKNTFEIKYEDVCYFENALEYAKMGLIPVGTYNNKKYSSKNVDIGNTPETYVDLLYDPQTSGGLLISLPENQIEELMKAFEEKNMETKVSIIGKVREYSDNDIFIKLI